ncbi:MAG: type IV pilus modification protein PilV [Woeseia sp.]
MVIKNSKGFTIIEVLVSMVVLSIGVLSLGLLQLTAIQNTNGGYLRSQATILAYDITDAMRANIPAVTAGDYRMANVAGQPTAPTIANVNCRGPVADCTTRQMATSDLDRWRNVLATYLPGGAGQVNTVDIGGTTQVTVTVSWVDPYSANRGAEQLVLVSEIRQ